MDAYSWTIVVLLLLQSQSPHCSSTSNDATSQPPHIVFIMADDLGFNDVGFRGSNQIPTPNIDALAYGGLILNQYYVSAVCTPSRSALMTGKHSIHTGMQHRVLYGAEPRGLPLREKLLPQYLKELGYTTRIVGKWHLGSFRREYTPTFRGFDSHLGYWTGHQDYFDHTAVETPYWGLDMRQDMQPAWYLHGKYSTDLFTEESVRIITTHNRSTPLFLYIAHAAVHSGNPYNPLPAPDEAVAKFNHIKNYKRSRFAAMLSKLDDSVGKVVESLSEMGMLQNTVLVFSTDNGGPAAGFNLNAASNWPLRGVKNTLWEGGVRGVGFIWSPLIERPSRVARQLFHITDWLPTLYRVAGGDPTTLHGLDGYDLWDALSDDGHSNRTDVLHNIDDNYRIAALTVGEWKIVKGSTYGGIWDGWYGPSGREESAYDVGQVLGSKAARAMAKLHQALIPEQVWARRNEAEIKCNPTEGLSTTGPTTDSIVMVTPKVPVMENECKPMVAPCLFNIRSDPCERKNLADRYPNIMRHLLHSLDVYNATAIPAANLPWVEEANPMNWGYTWTNFGDDLGTNYVS